MPLTGYMKIPEIAGESTVAGHEDEIEIFDLDWVVERDGATGVRTPARGRAKIAPLTLRKWYDASSPYLALAVTNGRLFARIDVTLRKALADQDLDYLSLRLTNCRVGACRISGTSESSMLAEEVEVSFESIEIRYRTSARDQSGGHVEHQAEIDARSII